MRFFIPVIVAALVITSACDSDYRPVSIGGIDEVIVVMDSTAWESETAFAIEETFGKYIETIPCCEQTYRLIFRDFRSNSELEDLRRYKNLIFAAPIDEDSNTGNLIRAILSDEVEARVREGESFAFPLNDRWMRDQWVLILTSNSDEELATKIMNSERALVGNLLDREFIRREAEVFRRGEQFAINDSLMQRHGWMVPTKYQTTEKKGSHEIKTA